MPIRPNGFDYTVANKFVCDGRYNADVEHVGHNVEHMRNPDSYCTCRAYKISELYERLRAACYRLSKWYERIESRFRRLRVAK